jgi:hypothetical protein
VAARRNAHFTGGRRRHRTAPQLRNADPTVLATAVTVANVHAAAEELLWHSLFVATFPDDPVRGWLWPAIGFTAWHPSPVGPTYRHGTRRSWRAVSGRTAATAGPACLADWTRATGVSGRSTTSATSRSPRTPPDPSHAAGFDDRSGTRPDAAVNA